MFPKKEKRLIGEGYFTIIEETGERRVVLVTNRNALPVEHHVELFNLNDEEHIYLEYAEDNLL